MDGCAMPVKIDFLNSSCDEGSEKDEITKERRSSSHEIRGLMKIDLDLSSNCFTGEVKQALQAYSKNMILLHQSAHIRLVIEKGLDQLPYEHNSVITPTGHTFEGIKFLRGNCGVSIMRSGEAMERGLRDCCRSLRIGKILIHTDENNKEEAKIFYAKLPPDIENRKVLLMYPILATGTTVLKALDVLRSYNVRIENVILLNLFTSPQSIINILSRNPDLKIVTSEVHSLIPHHFGQRYFGTN